MTQDVLIVGGGLAGLASAAELSRAGLRVTVVEKSHLLGGRAASWQDGQTTDLIDVGPHSLLGDSHNLLRFLEGLGTADDLVWQHDCLTLAGKPSDGHPGLRHLPAPLHYLPKLLASPQVAPRDVAAKRYLLWQVMRLSDQEIQRLDTQDAESWLRQMELSETFIDWFWRAASLSIMSVPLERCSAGALLRFLRVMAGKHSSALGFPATGLGELFVAASKELVESRGGQVLSNCGAAAFRLESMRVRGVFLAEGGSLEAPWCIAAVPPKALRELLPADQLMEPDCVQHFDRLGKLPASPWIATYLWFDRKLSRERHWIRVWSADDLNCEFQDLSNIRAGWEQRPSVIAGNCIHAYHAEGLDDDEIIRRSLRELADFLPGVMEARLRHARVHRVPFGTAAPYPGAERLRLPTRTPLEGLLLAGDWTDTGLPSSMESAVCSGYRAAEELLAAIGRPREIHIAPAHAEAIIHRMSGKRS